MTPRLIPTSLLALMLLPTSGLVANGATRPGPRLTLRYAAPAHSVTRTRRGAHFADLVGDRESGLGFYPLPARYRVHGRVVGRRGDAIRYAVATEAGLSYYGLYGNSGRGRSHSVFNPVDGYGSPFFAGYYGPAGDPDEDPGLFGRPYR